MRILKDFHSNYKRDIKKKIDELELDLKEAKDEFTVHINRINRMKPFIDECIDNITFEQLMTTKNPFLVYRVKLNSKAKNYSYDKTTLEIAFSTKRKYERDITSIKIRLNKLYKIRSQVNNKVFNFITTRFNMRIVDEIVNGYNFVAPHIGNIYVIRRQRGRRPVDWGRSNEYKDKLIAAGKTPYNKDTAPDGEKWLFYHDGEYAHYYFWRQSACRSDNRKDYKFVPTGGPKGNIKKLHDYIEDNPEVIHNFKIVNIR
jgi:hypothetical protein